MTATARPESPLVVLDPRAAAPEHHHHDRRHVALEDASRRWIVDGDAPEVVAAYAHALRDLIGDL